jgi:transposase InsO family protein
MPRRRRTTRQGRGRWRAPDLVGRQFGATAINQKWFGDGTEIVTDEGKLYLDSVLDIGSRRIVGFAMSEHHDSELACGALQMAVAVRGGGEAIAKVIFHSDQGSELEFNGLSQHRGRSQVLSKWG